MCNEEQSIEQNIRMRADLLWELEGRKEGVGDPLLAPGPRVDRRRKPLRVPPDGVQG